MTVKHCHYLLDAATALQSRVPKIHQIFEHCAYQKRSALADRFLYAIKRREVGLKTPRISKFSRFF